MLDKLPLDILSPWILNPLLIHKLPVNISGSRISKAKRYRTVHRNGVKTLSRNDLSLAGVSRGLRNVSLATFWTRNSFYINAEHRTDCERSVTLLEKQTEEVRSLIRRIEVDVSLFQGPKFQFWLRQIEPLVKLKGLSYKDVTISLLARPAYVDRANYPICFYEQPKVLRDFRRVLRWRFRKMKPEQFLLTYDIWRACCPDHAYDSWEGPVFPFRGCYRWLSHSPGNHTMVLRPNPRLPITWSE